MDTSCYKVQYIRRRKKRVVNWDWLQYWVPNEACWQAIGLPGAEGRVPDLYQRQVVAQTEYQYLRHFNKIVYFRIHLVWILASEGPIFLRRTRRLPSSHWNSEAFQSRRHAGLTSLVLLLGLFLCELLPNRLSHILRYWYRFSSYQTWLYWMWLPWR